MIDSIRIQNFKSWRDTTKIKLAPLTVFFGTNSSGKSSIGQFFAMLKQTAETTDQNIVLNLGSEGLQSTVNLGSFREVLHKGSSKLSFNLEFEMDSHLIDIKPGKKSDKKSIISFSSEIHYEKDSIFLESFTYTQNGNPFIKLKREERGKYTISETTLERKKGQFKKSIRKFYLFPDDVDSLFKNPEVLRNLNQYLDNLFSEIYYLGPIRQPPERIYIWPGYAPRDVGTRGEFTVPVLRGASKDKRKIISKSKKENKRPNSKDFEEIVKGWLLNLGLVSEFSIKGIRSDSSTDKARSESANFRQSF